MLNYRWPLSSATAGSALSATTSESESLQEERADQPTHDEGQPEEELMDDEDDEDEGEEDDEEDDEEEEDESLAKDSDHVARVADAVAVAQAETQIALNLPPEILEQVASWESQQAGMERDWRQQQATEK